MAKFKRMPNYREMYPDASDEVINCLKKGHRKMEYMEYDLKVERCCINAKSKTVTFIPSREDSLERLLDEDKQFKDSDETPEEIVIRAVMIRKMMDCVALLSQTEQELIEALFFQGKTEREYSESSSIHYEWLAQNAYKFGFICRYPSDKTNITGVINEPWHYRYVGMKAAAKIQNQGVCLEEYLNRTN